SLDVWKTIWEKVNQYKLANQIPGLYALFIAQHPYQNDTLSIKTHFLCVQSLKALKPDQVEKHIQSYPDMAHHAIKECSPSLAFSIISIAFPLHNLEKQKLLWEQALAAYNFNELLVFILT